MTVFMGIDLETTGLDPKTDKIIEVGVSVWKMDTGCKSVPILSFSNIIDPHQKIPEAITALTGLSSYDCERYGVNSLQEAMGPVEALLCMVDYFVAHNAKFEREFLAHNGYLGLISQRHWIDTKTDIPYPQGKGDGSLSEILMNHGIFNPMPHRALPDAFGMMQLLAKYPVADVVKISVIPKWTLICRSPYDPSGGVQSFLKGLGFYWDGSQKRWHKPCRKNKVCEEIDTLLEGSIFMGELFVETDTETGEQPATLIYDELKEEAENAIRSYLAMCQVSSKSPP